MFRPCDIEEQKIKYENNNERYDLNLKIYLICGFCMTNSFRLRMRKKNNINVLYSFSEIFYLVLKTIDFNFSMHKKQKFFFL
jgi:hypothetical protein